MVLRPPPNDTTQDLGQPALAATFMDHHANGHGDQGR